MPYNPKIFVFFIWFIGAKKGGHVQPHNIYNMQPKPEGCANASKRGTAHINIENYNKSYLKLLFFVVSRARARVRARAGPAGRRAG